MSLDPEGWTFGGIMTAVTALIGTIGLQQRKQVATLQGSLEKANEALEEERESCGERLSLIETRMDKERDDCDRRYRVLINEFDALRKEVRRYTPRDFPAVKEPGK